MLTRWLSADFPRSRVLAALREALQRFPDCVVIIWLPQVQLVEATQLPQRLKAAVDTAGKKGWLHARGVHLDSLDEDAVDSALKIPTLPPSGTPAYSTACQLVGRTSER